MGECLGLLAPQPSRKTSLVNPCSYPSSIISCIGLSSYRVPDYTHWFVVQHISPAFIIHLLFSFSSSDIKADNLMFVINDDSVFTDLEKYGLEKPVPRKEIDTDGRTIYMSQELKIPKKSCPASPLWFWFSRAWAIPLGIRSTKDLSSARSDSGSSLDIQRWYLECGMHGKTSKWPSVCIGIV